MPVTKSQALQTAERKALAFLKSVKSDVDTRKAADFAKALAATKYDDAEALARLAIAGKAQKILNRVASAAREGRIDANNLDRAKLRDIAGEALKDHQANLIMRNTLSAAYNAGYLEQGLADRTKAFWLYQTANDARVRPSHARWEGLLLEKSDPLAMQIFPPNGHNCRCVMLAVSRKVADAKIAEGTATTEKPALVYKDYADPITGEKVRTIEGVDPGWMGAPGDKAEATGKLLERALQRIQDTPI